jgi:predicted AlkP superfamily phosphohydrolase/phosphomutase
MRLFLFGLDGMPLDILRSYSKEAEFTNFRKLLHDGSATLLQSTYPSVTAPAWTSMFTGVNPGKHGIFDLVEESDGRLTVPNMRSVKIPFLWDYLSWAKKKVLVMGMPFIYPAPSVNGFFITGRLVPKLACHPESLLTKMDLSGFSPELDDSRLGNLLQERESMKLEKKEYAERLLAALEKRKEASISLIDGEVWDATIIVESMPDQLFHKFWGNKQVLSRMLRMLDSWLGEIIQRLKPEDRLIVVSDHGFTDVKGNFYLKSWLARKGYLPGLKADKRINLSTFFSKLVQRNKKREDSLMEEDDTKIRVRGVAASAWISIPGHSTDLRNALVEEFVPLTRTDMIQDCKRIEDVYSGGQVKRAPGDLLLIPKEGWSIDCEKTNSRGYYRLIDYPKGVHTPYGLFIYYKCDGKYIDRTLKIYDVTPTILKMFGLPIPDFVDGVPAF